VFLRANCRTKDGKDHLYWSLVETVRTADGPCQRTVCYLGELNTSVAAGNPEMRRGYSRDPPDFKQVVLALVVSPEGFPLAYEVFDGNRRDVTTVTEILDVVEATYGRAQRVWVVHRGLVSEQNLETLRARQAQYLVGTPRAQLKTFERELVTRDWHQVREEVEEQWVAGPGGDEGFVLCRSAMRRAKERAMRERASRCLEADLARLAAQVVTGKAADEVRIQRRIGRLLERYPGVATLYEIAVPGPRRRGTWSGGSGPTGAPGVRPVKGPNSWART